MMPPPDATSTTKRSLTEAAREVLTIADAAAETLSGAHHLRLSNLSGELHAGIRALEDAKAEADADRELRDDDVILLLADGYANRITADDLREEAPVLCAFLQLLVLLGEERVDGRVVPLIPNLEERLQDVPPYPKLQERVGRVLAKALKLGSDKPSTPVAAVRLATDEHTPPSLEEHADETIALELLRGPLYGGRSPLCTFGSHFWSDILGMHVKHDEYDAWEALAVCYGEAAHEEGDFGFDIGPEVDDVTRAARLRHAFAVCLCTMDGEIDGFKKRDKKDKSWTWALPGVDENRPGPHDLPEALRGAPRLVVDLLTNERALARINACAKEMLDFFENTNRSDMLGPLPISWTPPTNVAEADRNEAVAKATAPLKRLLAAERAKTKRLHRQLATTTGKTKAPKFRLKAPKPTQPTIKEALEANKS